MRDIIKLAILALVISIVLPLVGKAADVNLAWDASSSNVDGYVLFDRNFQKPYNYAVPSFECAGNVLTGKVTVPDDRQSAFVAQAFVYGPYDLQGNRTRTYSDNSNEVIYPGVTPPKPQPPRNFVMKILVAIVSFFGRLFG